MAALAIRGVGNAVVCIEHDGGGTPTAAPGEHGDGEQDVALEVPVMDGSAAPFLSLLGEVADCDGRDAGAPAAAAAPTTWVQQHGWATATAAAAAAAGVAVEAAAAAQLRYFEIVRPVAVAKEGSAALLLPLPPDGADGPELHLAVDIDFRARSAAMGRRRFRALLAPWQRRPCPATMATATKVLEESVAPARTFAFEADIAALRAAGLARGGSLENAVVFREDRGSGARSRMVCSLYL